jgi:serine/threonine protein kinase
LRAIGGVLENGAIADERPMNPNWVETQELLTATFEQPAGQREQFVREHCVDPALRETIASLVNPVVAGSQRTAVAGDTQPDLPSGSHVGPYVILHRLGRGGMGEVFLGRDPRLDRSVALKCLLTTRGGSEDLRAHVIREARAAARITHAHVAAVYDVLEHDGRAFIVMEYVEGESLAVLLQRGALPPERVVALGRQIADALAAAHGGGIVHRDLKPANIQVTPDGSIKILDFGIAKALASLTTTSLETTGWTETRAPVAGTPAYMAPEQLLGRGADERSDLFSLAAILFEMATGRRLFTSNEPFAVLMAAVRTLPRADRVDSKIPSQLADVIAKGLATDPADRFQSAVEMGRALALVRDELYSTQNLRSAPLMAAPRRAGRLRKAAIITFTIPCVVWMLGRLSSLGFNNTLDRFDTFASEPMRTHLVLGIRSLVGPAVYATLGITALWTGRFLLRVLALAPPAARAMDGLTTRWDAVTNRLNLRDPIVLAQALAMLGGVAVVGVLVSFSTLIDAWANHVSIAPASLVWRLSPANEDEKVLYRAVLTLLFLAFGAGLVWVLKLRAALGMRKGKGPLVALAFVVGLLFLLNVLPYRILWRSLGVRSEYDGARCYVIGEDPAQALLYCPDSAPPRNKVVQKNDSRFRSTGVVENIFSAR